MKVNFEKLNRDLTIEGVYVGHTFLAPRSRENKKILELYMKIDSFGGMIECEKDIRVAVNLETGMLRKFDKDFVTIPTNAEVIIK